MRLFAIFLILIAVGAAKNKVDDRLKRVAKVAITTESRAADRARQTLAKGFACFALVKAEDADALLDVSEQASALTDKGLLSSARATVSGVVTLKSGDAVWSRTASFPVSSSVESSIGTATDLLLKFLASDADCKARPLPSQDREGAAGRTATDPTRPVNR